MMALIKPEELGLYAGNLKTHAEGGIESARKRTP